MILVIFQTLSLQKYAYDWATDHRVHHKYVDTDADPHSSRRGLFFSHVGWLFLEREPEFVEKYNKMDFSDLHADKALMFQKKYIRLFVISPKTQVSFQVLLCVFRTSGRNFVTSGDSVALLGRNVRECIFYKYHVEVLLVYQHHVPY